MTISYSGNFLKLLFRWKGSLYKAVWVELLIFLLIYYLISGLYRFVLPGKQKRNFELVAQAFDGYTKDIPITFLLGFYVGAVVKRWWEQFQFVAWPDDILSYVCIIIPGKDPVQVRKRRRIARWLNLTACLAWRDISVSVRRRFPTMDHVVSAGLMTKREMELQTNISTMTLKWSFPIQWILKVVFNEWQSGSRYATPPLVAHFVRELNAYRNCFKNLYCYDWVCIPLVYTQVAALATYGYFTLCLIGRQFLAVSPVDLYVPIFTILQFTFYVGWFKVAQYLMRPFEEDDDDLELNYMIDRHIITSYSIVDEVQSMDIPEDEDIDVPKEEMHENGSIRKISSAPIIPYTRMAAKKKQHPPKLHVNVETKDPKDSEVVERLIPDVKKVNRIRQF